MWGGLCEECVHTYVTQYNQSFFGCLKAGVYVFKAGLELRLMIFPPQLPERWDYLYLYNILIIFIIIALSSFLL